MHWVDPLIFPPATAVILRFLELSITIDFWLDFFSSLGRLALGAAIAVPFALSFSVYIHFKLMGSALVKDLLSFSYSFPKVALLPLILMVFGLGEASKVALVSLGIFFLVWLNTQAGLSRISEMGFQSLAKVYKVSLFSMLTRVLLRGALPEILTGLKTGLGYGLVMVVVAEFSLGEIGLGARLWNSWEKFDILTVYATIFYLGLVSWSLGFLFDHLNRKYSRHYARI